jgi:membrane protein implicated in regulation of membrane protease activity
VHEHVSPNVFAFIGGIMLLVGVLLLVDGKYGGAIGVFAIAGVMAVLWAWQWRRLNRL